MADESGRTPPTEGSVATRGPATGTDEVPPRTVQEEIGVWKMELKDRALALPAQQIAVAALISAGALLLGSIGPWATATVLGITVSVSGLHGGGWVTLITALVGLVVLLDPRIASRAGWLYRHRRGTWRTLLWISLVVCILNFTSVENYGLAGVVNPGWGLYLALIAVLVSLTTNWMVRIQARHSAAPTDDHRRP